MSQHTHHARLRLIVAASIPAPRQRRKLKPKRRTANPRTLLLNAIPMQRQRIGGGWFSRADAPELYDLAVAVDSLPHDKRSLTFQGVRFPLKFGWRRYVCDPETGAILIGGRFLV